jgi:hypothetical protein
MKSKILLGLIIILFSSCNRYIVNSIDTKLGIKLKGKSSRVYKGVNTRRYNGKPVGRNWHRASEVQGVELGDSDLYKPIINENIFQILKDDKQKEYCHSIDIYNSRLNARRANEKTIQLDYIVEFPNKISLSEIFSEIAITKAVQELEVIASIKEIELTASFYSNFRNELKKELTTNLSSSAKLRYIIIDVQGIDLGADKNSLPIQTMIQSNLSEVLKQYSKSNKIIMGVAGFSITEYSSDAKIVQDNSMITAIDAAIEGETPELKSKIDKIKVSASVKWSKNVNQNIQTEINITGCSFFYPLWIKYSDKNKNVL